MNLRQCRNMRRRKWLIVGLAFSCCLFESCSSNPTVQNSGEQQQSSKPKFDFGTVAISPNSGKGREALLHVTVSGGSQKPGFLGVLINSTQNGEHACYIMQNFVGNDILLVLDSGVGTASLGAQKSVANHQCEVLRDGSTSSADGSNVNVTFHIRFAPGFHGVKHIWAMPVDNKFIGPDLLMVGDWTVE